MRISRYLREGQIILDLRAADKESAIKETAGALRQNPGVRCFDAFVHDIFERENFSTTGIGHGIGIPHARTEAVTDIVIALGRSASGIDFGSFDCKPARLIFVLGTPKRRELSLYLSVLARLTRLLERQAFRNTLLAAATPAEVLEAFRAVEE
jgi:mannitol/fructose-specific phosphotransferase system IIA component (Ntr-type)